MPKVQIVDLDGCIADDRWRREFIKPRPANGSNPPERFHLYHSQAWRDEVRNLDQLHPSAKIIVLTARPTEHRQSTLFWLRNVAKIEPYHMIHRNSSDHRPSVIVKREQLQWLISPQLYGVRKEDIVSAIDDLSTIVEMYREHGIDAKIVRIGEEEHVV